MKVLLTGASGFVGSHILDSLRARNIPTALLLRPSSSRSFVERHLSVVEIRNGSINDPSTLGPALNGISHVIHCAGCTKSIGPALFDEINHVGTRNLVEAANGRAGQIKRFVHISSLAAAGPGTPEHPVTEADPPRPVSNYGRSKLAGETEVRNRCSASFVIIRPPAVYGPRDQGFLSMFKSIQNHVLPRPEARQFLSLVYVKDLAEVVAGCLEHPAAAGKTYFAASQEVVTGRTMAEGIQQQAGTWVVPLPLPSAFLWVVCLLQEGISRISGKPHVLSLQKHAELRAPGWVCDASKLTRETGLQCPTSLASGIATTLAWYQDNGWLRQA